MKERTNCILCSKERLEPVLDLGNLHLNAFPKPGEPDSPRSPLLLATCRSCNLLQLGHRTNPDDLYRTYWYRSGTNETMRRALRDITTSIENRMFMQLQAGDFVVDIGSNDNTLLKSYTVEGLHKVGFEPSNIGAEVENEDRDIKVINDYFRFIPLLENRAEVVTSIAMFYGLEDPHSFIRDVKKIMTKNGMWVLQLAYLPSILERNAFDGVCHEHVAYYSLHTLDKLLRKHGMVIVDAKTVDLNEGSIRLYVKKRRPGLVPNENVENLLEMERGLGLDTMIPYFRFAERVHQAKRQVTDFLLEKRREGKSIHGYGASTKGNTLLQFFKIDNVLLDAIWERQPQKWEHETVGTRIPIISEEMGREMRPDYLLILPWHFAPEFLEREREYLEAGGSIIIPLPEFRVVTAKELTA